ncbi:fibronectin type III domain-containing protein [Geomonas sp. Red875]|uniref:Fibronectin type III domain-containing protein n=2 Tax=Geomesophilobacter sediminis TaxID=2798584 RepID=A0A8J7M3H1_9BACT|nr:fibronectin type III domain-containing protein [Geomesophilobacter sediminis]
MLLPLALGLPLLLSEGCGKGSAPVQAPASAPADTSGGSSTAPPTSGGGSSTAPTSGGTTTTAPASRKVTLQWNPNPPDNLAGYKVYYREDSPSAPFTGTGATQGSSPVDVSNQTTAVISGLETGHTYYFAVTAYNSAGEESPYSNIVSAP